MEIRYSVWSLWYAYDYPSCYFLQHEKKGDLLQLIPLVFQSCSWFSSLRMHLNSLVSRVNVFWIQLWHRFFSMICDSQFCVVCEELPTNDLLICWPTVSLLSIFFLVFVLCQILDLKHGSFYIIALVCLNVPQITSSIGFLAE